MSGSVRGAGGNLRPYRNRLIDKVYRQSTLQAAWQQVKANRGAAGIDRQSIEGFAANELVYLGEL